MAAGDMQLMSSIATIWSTDTTMPTNDQLKSVYLQPELIREELRNHALEGVNKIKLVWFFMILAERIVKFFSDN